MSKMTEFTKNCDKLLAFGAKPERVFGSRENKLEAVGVWKKSEKYLSRERRVEIIDDLVLFDIENKNNGDNFIHDLYWMGTPEQSYKISKMNFNEAFAYAKEEFLSIEWDFWGIIRNC